jgi:PAS domain
LRDSHQITDKGVIRGLKVAKFRTQLLLDEQRQFFDIWQSASKGASMPTRAQISPCQFSSLWPYVSLFEFMNNEIMKVTVAGSGLRQVLGADPKSLFLHEEIDGGLRNIVEVRQTQQPLCGISSNSTIGRTGMMRFWMRLPLGFGQKVDEVIGLDLTLNAARAPLWAIEQLKSQNVL